ncbi:MAG TPA: amidohydrolase family protein [Thermodesulfobacteriota bacterium]|nr:amidohydrolase family protein [Thermodesulfobacteriota bacterium]
MSETVIFKNGFLIDGRGGEPVPDAAVVVAEKKIQEVLGPGKESRISNARVIDLKGKTLMPGLIDAHVHVGNIEVVMERTAALPPAVYVHRATRNLETDLDLGFTTLRDAGGLDWGFRAAIEQDLIRGPRVLLSVNMVTQTGGHGDKRGWAKEQQPPRNSIGMYPEVCDGPDEVRRGVRETLRRGADQVKVMADGGVVSPSDKPGQWQYTVEELKAAVESAEAAKTYVMAHTYTPKAMQNCLRAGVRSLEHGNLLDAETAKMIAEKGAFLVPTLTVFDILAKEGKGSGLDPFILSKLDFVREGMFRALELAWKAGVKIGSGTDIIGPFQYLKGRELALKAQVMGPLEAIISATRTNAELLCLENEIGTVEAGKLADLIVLEGNPLRDITLFEKGLQKVLLVMKEGRILKDRM